MFALAIGGSWAKERAGGAFAAGLAFILINRITGTIFGVSGDMLKNPDAMVTTFFGGSIKVAAYFISVLEAPALNMGGIRRDYLRFCRGNCLQQILQLP